MYMHVYACTGVGIATFIAGKPPVYWKTSGLLDHRNNSVYSAGEGKDL